MEARNIDHRFRGRGLMQNIVVFGTYDQKNHPRVDVLIESLGLLDINIIKCNVPLDFNTQSRIQLVRQPWRLIGFCLKLLKTWFHLVLEARKIGRSTPDVVVVGYMGVLDIHLAKMLFRAPVVLDHLAPLNGIAIDRSLPFRSIFKALDQFAEHRSSCILIDTDENLANVFDKSKAVVVPVGVSTRWLKNATKNRTSDGPLRVCYFGAFTPLHGVAVIADAIFQLKDSDIRWTLIGRGQEFDTIFERLNHQSNVTWIDWLEESQLIEIVAQHDICLGVFGQSAKAMSVTPTKVFQGAAAGCAILTSDTPPQRAMLGAGAVFVPPHDADELVAALRALIRDRALVNKLGEEATCFAQQNFSPRALSGRLQSAIELAILRAP